MSIHASKGLEFGCVLIVGVEEGSFPSVPGGGIFGKPPKKKESEGGDNEKEGEEEAEELLDEERRLLYVGMTRAKKKLYLMYRSRATLGGSGSNSGSGKAKAKNIPIKPSRFLSDLPKGTRFSRAST